MKAVLNPENVAVFFFNDEHLAVKDGALIVNRKRYAYGAFTVVES